MTAKRDYSGQGHFFIAAFFLLALTIYSVETVLARSAAFTAHPAVMTFAILVDLAFFVPFLGYVLLVRLGNRSLSLLLPLFLVGITIASLILPEGHRAGASWLRLVAAPLELVGLALIVLRVRRALREWEGGNVETQIESVVGSVLGGNHLGTRAVAAELTVLYYSLFTLRTSSPTGAKYFSTVENSGWGGVVFGLGIASLFEAIAVHFLVAQWSVLGTWVLTVLSLYGVLWLFADYQASRLNPVVCDGQTLSIQAGLRGRVSLPLSQIAEVRQVLSHPARRVPGYANLVVFGPPQFRLHLTEPVTIEGPFGLRRRAHLLGLSVDNPEAFTAALGITPSPAPSAGND